jgi:CRISPR-associated protein (TIGR02710 family)
LWLNAQRRATQGRFDDAVARGYRLLEWTAQWLLAQAGVDAADVHSDQIPEGLGIAANSDGKRKAALLDAWRLAAHHCGDDVARFVADEGAHMLDHLQHRNHSILAHGSTPVSRSDWERFAGWLEASLLPLYAARAKRVGLKALAPQLPRHPLWRAQQNAA